MIKKLFFSVMLAVVLVFGMTVVGCGDDDPGGGGDDVSGSSGLTITGLGAYNGKYVWAYGLLDSDDVYADDAITACASIDLPNMKYNLARITNGSATLKVFNYMSQIFTGSGSATISICIHDTASVSFMERDYYANETIQKEANFVKGKASVNAGTGSGGPGGGPVNGGGPTLESAFTLTENQWANSTVASASSVVWYKFAVSSGKTYYVWWNDRDNGDGSKNGDVVVRAKYSNNTYIFGNASSDDSVDSGWTSAESFTASQTGTVYLEVRPYNLSSYSTGTFAIVYSTSSTRPGTSGGNPPIGTSPSITIVNNTGVSIPYGYLKPPTATNWSANRLTSALANGSSQTITLSQTIAENNKYDFMLRTAESGGTIFRKYSVTVSSGSTVTITDADRSDGRELSTVYLRNRIGKNFDGFYYKSSSSSDWGANFGTITYNSQDNTSLLVSVHPSVNTVFDFQLRTSNPTNTYTKRNVTVTDGMTITFTSADSDTPLTGNPVIVIHNNTGEQWPYTYIKPAGADGWGSDLLPINQQNGQSYAYTLGAPLSDRAQYDIRVQGFTQNYVKWNVTVTEGMILTFDSSDRP